MQLYTARYITQIGAVPTATTPILLLMLCVQLVSTSDFLMVIEKSELNYSPKIERAL